MAITVKKSMLQGRYSWQMIAVDDPKVVRIDATLFNRHEGYEVIPMIQKVVSHFDYNTESDVERIEKLISDELPGNIRGQKNVLEWLINHLS